MVTRAAPGSALLVLVCTLLAFPVRRAAAEGPPPNLEDSKPASSVIESRRAEAEERRQRALRLYDSGNYNAARGEFERANQLMPSFRLLYNLGVVSTALGDSAGAYDFFCRYLSEGGSQVPAELRTQIELQLRDLAQQVATLIVVVDTTDAQVFVDETQVGNAPLALPIHVNVGSRRVSARSASARTVSRTLTVLGGETVRVELQVAAPPTPPSLPRRQIAWVGWATTAAFAAGATVTGLEALATHNEYRQKLATIGTTRSELDSLDRRATKLSIATDALGAAAIVACAYSLYVSLRHPAPPAASATQPAVQLHGSEARFILRF